MEQLSPVVTLFLVMDPLGNVPLFLSVLKTVPPERRRVVLMREIGSAYLALVAVLLVGDYLRRFLGLEQQAVSIAGGIVLFLIALRMIFPAEDGSKNGTRRSYAVCSGEMTRRSANALDQAETS